MKIYLNPFRINRWIRTLLVVLFINPLSYMVGYIIGFVTAICGYFPSDETFDSWGPFIMLTTLIICILFVAHRTVKSEPEIVDAEYEEIIVLTDVVESLDKE